MLINQYAYSHSDVKPTFFCLKCCNRIFLDQFFTQMGRREKLFRWKIILISDVKFKLKSKVDFWCRKNDLKCQDEIRFTPNGTDQSTAIEAINEINFQTKKF